MNGLLSKMMMFLPLLLVLATNDHFLIWMWMELSLFGLVSVFNSSIINNKEKMLYYFILQIVSSFLILWGGTSNPMVSSLFFFGMLIKLAFLPSSWWFLLMMKMEVGFVMFVLTLQKMFYFIFMMYFLMSKWFFYAMLLSVIMNVFTYGQNSILNMIILSSIFNNIWICLSLVISKFIFWFYIMTYWMGLLAVFSCFSNEPPLTKANQVNLNKICAIFNVSGLPPFFMFWPKIIVLMGLKMMSLLMMILLTSSIYNMAVYLRLSGFMMLSNSKITHNLVFSILNFFGFLLLVFNL